MPPIRNNAIRLTEWALDSPAVQLNYLCGLFHENEFSPHYGRGREYSSL